jgi:hypothetical protein
MSKAKIFSKAHYDSLIKAERELHDVLPDIDSAEACGLDCTAYRDAVLRLQESFSSVKQHFMTPPPKR